MTGFKVFSKTLMFSTRGDIDFVDLTGEVEAAVASSGVRSGIVHVFAPHATGILVLTENDAALLEDIREFLQKIVPKDGGYRHPSNAYSHLRSMLLPPDRTLPVIEGHMKLGTWQSLMFVETDVHARRRTVVLQVLGEQ